MIRVTAPTQLRVTMRRSNVSDERAPLIAGDDAAPWNVLHDGVVVWASRDRERRHVGLLIEIPYVRRRFREPGDCFRLELSGCTRFSYTPYDEEAIEDPALIVAAAPDLAEAKSEDGRMTIWGGAGVLRLRYDALALFLAPPFDGTGACEPGISVSLASVESAARDYWNAWRAHHARKA